MVEGVPPPIGLSLRDSSRLGTPLTLDCRLGEVDVAADGEVGCDVEDRGASSSRSRSLPFFRLNPSKLFMNVSFILFRRSVTSPWFVSIGPLVGESDSAGGDVDIWAWDDTSISLVIERPDEPGIAVAALMVENRDEGAVDSGETALLPSVPSPDLKGLMVEACEVSEGYRS